MGQVKYIASIMMIAIFTLAVISFVIDFGSENDAVINLIDDGSLVTVRTELQSNITDFVLDIDSASEVYEQSNIPEGADTFRTPTVFTFMGDTAGMVGSILTSANLNIFGDDPGVAYIFLLITGFFATLLILYTWKTLRGNPD